MSQIHLTKDPRLPWMSRGGFLSDTDVSRGSPTSLMRRFADEIERAFGSATDRSREESDYWTPLLEISEHDSVLKICAEVPGLRKEDMKVEVSKDALILQGERAHTHREKHRGFYQSERNYGRFYRAIPLPEGANIDKATAELANGTLEISIPIPETDMTRRQIPVQEGGSRAGFFIDRPTVS